MYKSRSCHENVQHFRTELFVKLLLQDFFSGREGVTNQRRLIQGADGVASVPSTILPRHKSPPSDSNAVRARGIERWRVPCGICQSVSIGPNPDYGTASIMSVRNFCRSAVEDTAVETPMTSAVVDRSHEEKLCQRTGAMQTLLRWDPVDCWRRQRESGI